MPGESEIKLNRNNYLTFDEPNVMSVIQNNRRTYLLIHKLTETIDCCNNLGLTIFFKFR